MPRRRATLPAFAAAALTMATTGNIPDVAHADDAADLDEERRCLALTMYFEARSEGLEGMRAVGAVVLNRVESDLFPSTICEVVHQGGETPPCQFSWWCDGKSDVPRDRAQWELALRVAAEMLEDRGEDPTGGALFFHRSGIPMPWNVERTRTVEIHGHVYYR
ncbi:MAG: cell wall hydrolase [Gammaproteobacteria bacterium]|nr:cell wall hydrolase [Gammaproteobacteria bacterium]